MMSVFNYLFIHVSMSHSSKTQEFLSYAGPELLIRLRAYPGLCLQVIYSLAKRGRNIQNKIQQCVKRAMIQIWQETLKAQFHSCQILLGSSKIFPV